MDQRQGGSSPPVYPSTARANIQHPPHSPLAIEELQISSQPQQENLHRQNQQQQLYRLLSPTVSSASGSGLPAVACSSLHQSQSYRTPQSQSTNASTSPQQPNVSSAPITSSSSLDSTWSSQQPMQLQSRHRDLDRLEDIQRTGSGSNRHSPDHSALYPSHNPSILLPSAYAPPLSHPLARPVVFDRGSYDRGGFIERPSGPSTRAIDLSDGGNLLKRFTGSQDRSSMPPQGHPHMSDHGSEGGSNHALSLQYDLLQDEVREPIPHFQDIIVETVEGNQRTIPTHFSLSHSYLHPYGRATPQQHVAIQSSRLPPIASMSMAPPSSTEEQPTLSAALSLASLSSSMVGASSSGNAGIEPNFDGHNNQRHHSHPFHSHGGSGSGSGSTRVSGRRSLPQLSSSYMQEPTTSPYTSSSLSFSSPSAPAQSTLSSSLPPTSPSIAPVRQPLQTQVPVAQASTPRPSSTGSHHHPEQQGRHGFDRSHGAENDSRNAREHVHRSADGQTLTHQPSPDHHCQQQNRPNAQQLKHHHIPDPGQSSHNSIYSSPTPSPSALSPKYMPPSPHYHPVSPPSSFRQSESDSSHASQHRQDEQRWSDDVRERSARQGPVVSHEAEAEQSDDDNGSRDVSQENMRIRFGTEMPATVDLKTAIESCDILCKFALHYANQGPWEAHTDTGVSAMPDINERSNLQTIRNMNSTMLMGAQSIARGTDGNDIDEDGVRVQRRRSEGQDEPGEYEMDEDKDHALKFGQGPPSDEMVHELARAATSIFQLAIRLKAWVGMSPEERELDEEINMIRSKRCLFMDGTTAVRTLPGVDPQASHDALNRGPAAFKVPGEDHSMSSSLNANQHDMDMDMRSHGERGHTYSQFRAPVGLYQSTASSTNANVTPLNESALTRMIYSPMPKSVSGADKDKNVPHQKYRKRAKRTHPPGKCLSCQTSDTPEWRRGPDGPRTLCNACGLHYAKLLKRGQHQQQKQLQEHQQHQQLLPKVLHPQQQHPQEIQGNGVSSNSPQLQRIQFQIHRRPPKNLPIAATEHMSQDH